LLRGMSVEVARVRRGEAQAEQVRNEREWLLLEKTKLEVEREKKRKLTEEEKWATAMQEENRKKIAEGYVSGTEKITRIRRAFMADVNHPVNVAEAAVSLALVDLRPTDPGFGRRVAELIAGGLLKYEDEAVAMDEFVEEIAAAKKGEGQNIQHPTPNIEHPMTEALSDAAGGKDAAPVDQGQSRLIKVDQGEGSTQRLEDSKGGEDAGAEGDSGRLKAELRTVPLADAPHVQDGVSEQGAVKVDQGGSSLCVELDAETKRVTAEVIARVQYGCGAEEVEARKAEWLRTRGDRTEVVV
jgi:hypothetical protein